MTSYYPAQITFFRITCLKETDATYIGSTKHDLSECLAQMIRRSEYSAKWNQHYPIIFLMTRYPAADFEITPLETRLILDLYEQSHYEGKHYYQEIQRKIAEAPDRFLRNRTREAGYIIRNGSPHGRLNMIALDLNPKCIIERTFTGSFDYNLSIEKDDVIGVPGDVGGFDPDSDSDSEDSESDTENPEQISENSK